LERRASFTFSFANTSNHHLQIRSEFDDILLNHAACSGAKVFQETRVTSLDFAPPTPPQTPIMGNSDSPANQQQASLSPTLRPIAAHYTTSAGLKGTIAFDYLVDASGRNGIMSTKYLRNRHMNSSLQNIACWGYWENGGVYMPGTSRNNAPFFQALNGE
jgi:flavin-dependent dehydrogenase